MKREDFDGIVLDNYQIEIDLAWPTLEGPHTNIDIMELPAISQMAIRDGIRIKYAVTIRDAKTMWQLGHDPTNLLQDMLETIREDAPELEETIMEEIYGV